MIRVAIAEDQFLVRDALARLLAMEPDFLVTGQARDGHELLALVEQTHPDLCLVDIEMPGKDGLEACAEIHQRYPDVALAILTTFGRPGYLKRALDSGVCGYLVKDLPVTELTQKIRAMMQGQRVIDPQLAVDALYRGDNPLSSREVEILQCATDHQTIKEIAHALFLGEGTVRNYLSVIYQKLEVSTRSEAIAKARDMGWL